MKEDLDDDQIEDIDPDDLPVNDTVFDKKKFIK